MKEGKRKGHHYGYIKGKGTMKVMLSNKIFWMRRIHVLRRLLGKYKESRKIDKNMVSHTVSILNVGDKIQLLGKGNDESLPCHH